MIKQEQATFIRLKFFFIYYLFIDTNATCLRLETFDQAEVKMIEITYFFFINGLNFVIIWLIWYETPVICRKK